MKNRKLIFIGLFIFLSVVIGSFIYFPKSIDTALNRIKYPFEVGEILTSQQIDENLIVVIYTNKIIIMNSRTLSYKKQYFL